MKDRLHIGCGKNYLPPEQGWVNHDAMSCVKADVYCDMSALPFDRESFREIYASHVLEHAHRHQVLSTLVHWRSLLKPGGILKLAVPDFEAVVKHYVRYHDIPAITGLLYGGQDTPNNMHHIAFDMIYLERLLMKAGFTDIKRWEWRTTDHADFDDFSQCYLPHMNKDSGMLMSLNVQATKP